MIRVPHLRENRLSAFDRPTPQLAERAGDVDRLVSNETTIQTRHLAGTSGISFAIVFMYFACVPQQMKSLDTDPHVLSCINR
jgi:hypothetical protein